MHRLVAPLVALLVGCVAGNGDEGMFISKNVAVGSECSFDGNPSAAFIGHGSIASISPAPYELHPQVQSNITNAGMQTEEQRTILISGARVDVQFVDETVISRSEAASLGSLVKFQSLFSAPLAPGGTADIGV